MMKKFSVYDPKTGLFTGVVYECLEENMRANIPEGHACHEGHIDHLSQRRCCETGKILDYVPVKPSERHEWNGEIKRWVYVPTALEVCQDRRRTAYPDLVELADALYHKELGDDSKMHDYLERCIKVKEKFPKPK